ncbi:putative integral membrane protein [Rosellinia necatrix]|uniref:Putative integral membrane protein n=1 Tax=Rosellinia necatrix TaxID=77044 RepID=A0A1S7UJA2_ROSNE|nr:putative integral membrane protein [Rosellinia necatrix]
MEIDPTVLAVFGPPPPGIDLLAKQETAIIVVALVSTAFATVALGLRIWARNFQRFGMMADDYLMIIALIFTYGTLVITILGAKAGAGRHLWSLHPQDIADIFRLLYSYTFIYAGSVSFTKLSILLFYRRLFERGSTWFHIRLGFAAFFTIGYVLSIWAVAAALCQPTEFFWTQFLGAKGKCLDINASFLSLTVLNLVADLLVLVVPIPEILALKMSTKKKVGVLCVMLLGGLVCVVSAVRIWAFYRFTVEVDITWVQADVFLLSSVEPGFGIVSACLPSLRPLYRRARAKITGKEIHGSSTGTWYATSKASRVGNSYVRFGDDSSRSGERDDIALTSIGKGPNTNKPIPQNIILVRSEITQSSSNPATRQNNSIDSY